MNAESRREKHRQEVRATILEAAGKALMRGGREGLSMRELAASIGYAPGSIYLHFKNKRDLVYHVVEESFARLDEALRQIPGRVGGIRRLKKMLRVYADFGLRLPHHYQVAFMMPSMDDPRANQAVPHPAYQRLRQIVQECMEKKLLRRGDVEATCQTLWSAVHGITSLLITKPDFPWSGREKIVTRVIDTVIAGLRSGGKGTA